MFADVLGVEVAPVPELFGGRGIAAIRLGQPGRPRHDLAHRLAVMRQVAHLRVDDAQIHQRKRLAGLAAQRQLLFGVEDESGFTCARVRIGPVSDMP